jgi:cephalosporin hydroxylase
MVDLPPAVTVDMHAPALRDYFKARASQHTQDVYAGVQLSKFPEDLRVYEHLLWLSRANTVIELGSWCGGSALWLRDRLAAMVTYGRIANPRVITVDIDIEAARTAFERTDQNWAESITLLAGDVRDPALPERVAAELAPDAHCLVIEDTLHTYETTRAVLDGFARFVAPAGFFVVEDGCVDDEALRLDPAWPRGVRPALDDWLSTPTGQDFAVRRDLELYGVSCHPSGFLQRREA